MWLLDYLMHQIIELVPNHPSVFQAPTTTQPTSITCMSAHAHSYIYL